MMPVNSYKRTYNVHIYPHIVFFESNFILVVSSSLFFKFNVNQIRNDFLSRREYFTNVLVEIFFINKLNMSIYEMNCEKCKQKQLYDFLTSFGLEKKTKRKNKNKEKGRRRRLTQGKVRKQKIFTFAFRYFIRINVLFEIYSEFENCINYSFIVLSIFADANILVMLLLHLLITSCINSVQISR